MALFLLGGCAFLPGPQTAEEMESSVSDEYLEGFNAGDAYAEGWLLGEDEPGDGAKQLLKTAERLRRLSAEITPGKNPVALHRKAWMAGATDGILGALEIKYGEPTP